jgi:hypothetical protein
VEQVKVRVMRGTGGHLHLVQAFTVDVEQVSPYLIEQQLKGRLREADVLALMWDGNGHAFQVVDGNWTDHEVPWDRVIDGLSQVNLIARCTA